MLTQAYSEHFPLNLPHVFACIYKITDALKTLSVVFKKFCIEGQINLIGRNE